MNTYTYFWVKEEGSGVISPYFNSEAEAKVWAEDKLASLEEAEEFAEKRNYDYIHK